MSGGCWDLIIRPINCIWGINCVCTCKEVGVRIWYRGGGAIFLGTAVFGVGGGVRIAISRSIRLTSEWNNQKTVREGKQQVCHDPCLAYTERFLRVTLEIGKIDVLFVRSGVCRCGALFRVSVLHAESSTTLTNTKTNKPDVYSTDLQRHT